mmetsp:Transcript_24638/g.50584  ORF Transcript_24638/g.50584 Transcript_24638/m.50584 type:complete len:281 (+) Transcript_24638:758-1600(+)
MLNLLLDAMDLLLVVLHPLGEFCSPLLRRGDGGRLILDFIDNSFVLGLFGINVRHDARGLLDDTTGLGNVGNLALNEVGLLLGIGRFTLGRLQTCHHDVHLGLDPGRTLNDLSGQLPILHLRLLELNGHGGNCVLQLIGLPLEVFRFLAERCLELVLLSNFRLDLGAVVLDLLDFLPALVRGRLGIVHILEEIDVLPLRLLQGGENLLPLLPQLFVDGDGIFPEAGEVDRAGQLAAEALLGGGVQVLPTKVLNAADLHEFHALLEELDLRQRFLVKFGVG